MAAMKDTAVTEISSLALSDLASRLRIRDKATAKAVKTSSDGLAFESQDNSLTLRVRQTPV
jgi:hypothetical protein